MFCYQVFMPEPSLRTSRLALAGGIVAAVVLGGGGFLIGRATTERPALVVSPIPIAVPTPSPTATVRGVLGRAELVALANGAADALAAGKRTGDVIPDTAGRRFEIRLPFGCEGPASESSTAAMRWRYDADEQTLRIQAAPVGWIAADWWGQNAPDNVDVIEGFWIARPWTTSEACPGGADRPAAIGAEAVTLTGQTLALGQMFAKDGPRRARRDGQPYRNVMRIPPDRLDTTRGFRLHLTGRLASMPGDAGPVRCRQPGGTEQRPICLVGVTFDRIAIENAANGEVVATWDTATGDSRAGQ